MLRIHQRRTRRIFSALLALVLLASLISPAAGYAATAFSQPQAQSSGANGGANGGAFSGANSARAQSGGDGHFSTTPCSDFKVPAVWREGVDVQCGYLTVPTEHASVGTSGTPSSSTIQLGVVILKSTNPNPPPDPIVMLQGGPGASTIDTYTQLIPMQGARLRANRDIILFDQRGTLYTKPSLVCPEYMDLSIQLLDVKLTPEQSDQKFQQAMAACRARLEKEGINLSAFDSLENAADIESLRLALGYDKINLYGVSYGTLLALHYMRQYPGSLRTVILDSTVPPQINFVLDAPRSEDRSFEALFAACTADADCNAAYPNLRQVFFDLVDQLNKNPVHIQLNDPYSGNNKSYQALLDGDTLLSSTFQMMYNTDIIPFVPKMIYDVRAGNYSFLERILSVITFDRTMSMGMYYSVMCSEDADINPQDYNLTGLPPQIVANEKDSVTSFLSTCKIWNVQPLGAQADQAVSSSVPTLVLSGAFDPITPPKYGQEAAQTLSHSYFFEFPNGGHGEAMTGPCSDSVMVAFLNDPNNKPDAACISQLGGPKFITPGALVRLPNLVQILNGQGTALPELLLYALGLLFLLTALVIYPIVWLVRFLRGSRRPTPAYPAVGYPPADASAPGQYPNPAQNVPPAQVYTPAPESSRRPLLYRLAPWLAALTGLLLLVFTAVLVGIIFNMVAKNDTLILMGLPAASRPLFVLPILAIILTVVMFVAALVAWARRAGSVWGRLYLTLLTLSAAACVVVLSVWGMVTALFA